MKENVTVTWLGHACFKMEYKNWSLVIDPYADGSVPGLGPVRETAGAVYCSHGHGDHSAADVVKLRTGGQNPFTITAIDTFHDPQGGALRGPNTIHLLEVGGLRAAHFGDIGCELTPTQLAELQGLDVAMIPVGGFYTIGPEEAKALMDKLGAKVVVPMHYRMGDVGLPAIAELDDFLALAGDYVYYPGNSITINAGTRPQIAVLTYQP